jgi:hypothetical protein
MVNQWMDPLYPPLLDAEEHGPANESSGPKL